MSHRRKPVRWFRIILLVLLIAGGAYVDRFIIPTQPSPFVPTPTVTRSPESFVTEADQFFKDGKLLQAIDAYKQAIAADPENPAIYVSLARVQVFAGQYKDAQTSAEDAILLNPDNSMAHAVLAWSLDFQGNYLDAQDAIERALTLDSNNPLAHAYYAEILMDANLSGTGALGSLEKAIEESGWAIEKEYRFPPDVIRASDMYKNFFSAQGQVLLASPQDSRLLNKPLVRNVLHGGGQIFLSATDPDVQTIEYWITHPSPQGQDEFSQATWNMFVGNDPSNGQCKTQ